MSLEVQIVFVGTRVGGVFADCVVTSSRTLPSAAWMQPGQPFSLLIDRALGPVDLDRAFDLLRRWSTLDATVSVSSSPIDDGRLVLSHDGTEMVLSVD